MLRLFVWLVVFSSWLVGIFFVYHRFLTSELPLDKALGIMSLVGLIAMGYIVYLLAITLKNPEDLKKKSDYIDKIIGKIKKERKEVIKMGTITIHFVDGQKWQVEESEIKERSKKTIVFKREGSDEIFEVPLSSIRAIEYPDKETYERIQKKFFEK